MTDNDNLTDNHDLQPPLPEEAVAEAGPLSDVDPDKLAKLRERLAAFKKSTGETVTGSEDPDAPAQVTFDPEKFEVEPELEHLYKRATLEKTAEGMKWVVIEHQYLCHSGAWHIENSGQPMGKTKHGKTLFHAKGLDHLISEIVNGPEGVLSRQKGWRLSALLPGTGMSQGVAVFERQVQRALPDPKPIVRPEEEPIEKTTDEELVRMNERAKAWQAGESGEPDVPSTEEIEGAREVADTPEEDVNVQNEE